MIDTFCNMLVKTFSSAFFFDNEHREKAFTMLYCDTTTITVIHRLRKKKKKKR